MTCPVCGCDTKVINSRNVDCETIRRRRLCVDCGYRFSTEETEIELKKSVKQPASVKPLKPTGHGKRKRSRPRKKTKDVKS